MEIYFYKFSGVIPFTFGLKTNILAQNEHFIIISQKK